MKKMIHVEIQEFQESQAAQTLWIHYYKKCVESCSEEISLVHHILNFQNQHLDLKFCKKELIISNLKLWNSRRNCWLKSCYSHTSCSHLYSCYASLDACYGDSLEKILIEVCGLILFRFEIWVLCIKHSKFSLNMLEFQVGWKGSKSMKRMKFVKSKLKIWKRGYLWGFGEAKTEYILKEIEEIDRAEQEGPLSKDGLKGGWFEKKN